MKLLLNIFLFLILVYSLDCLVCEKYFSGIPLVKKSALEKTNMTCSSPDAYCVNATVKVIKWDFVARSCSDDASVIKKIHKDFNGICTVSKINSLSVK
uniref:Uncharacterized protein n=1 Tax=Strongyloides papillosus TaxID=174720 RepID=A0A0N5BN85_STREA